MRRHGLAVPCLILTLLLSTLLSQTTPAPPREHFQNADMV